jgi:hypothetical protein
MNLKMLIKNKCLKRFITGNYVYRDLKDKLKDLKATNKNYVDAKKKFETLE